MLHAGRGRAIAHKNRKPQGLGTPTPTPSVGNLILASNWADFLSKYAAAVPGDVISINHGGYTPTTPQVFTANSVKTGVGVRLIGASNQIVRIVIDGQTDLRNDFVNWYCSADAVNGNETDDIASVAASIYCNNSSGYTIRGCVLGQGFWPLYTRGCSNFVQENNVFFFTRHDYTRYDNGPSQFLVKGNLGRDNIRNGSMYWYNDGRAPIFWVNPGDAFGYHDAEHADGAQAFSLSIAPGSPTDFEISNNDYYVDGQLVFFADSFGTTQARGKVTGNTFTGTHPHFLMMDNPANLEVTNNVFAQAAVMNPVYTAALFTMPGTPLRLGGNTVPASSSFTGTTLAAFTGAISGTVTPPTAPAYTGTGANVGGFPAIPSRAAYTPFSGTPQPISLPALEGAASYNVGDYVTAWPCLWKGYYYGIEDNLYSRFKLNGTIVRASTQGRAAMVYQTAAPGSLTVEFSADNVNWSAPSAAKTVNAVGTTLDPSDKSANITLSGGNLIATHTGTDNTHSLAKSIADVPAANGNYVWAQTVIPISGSQSGIAIIGNAKSNSIDPHDFDGPCFAIFGNGALFGSGGLSSNLGNMGGAGKAYGSGQEFLIYFRRTGGTDLLFVRYPDGTWSSATGDPTGAGAGINVSAATGGAVLSAPAYTYKTGDVVNMNYTPSTAGLGSVTLLT